ncbi:ras-related protein Rab-4B isoform X2 [Hemicordylus capensis]|uniref:ras-related protein Rab-4B isoform X2 n=1 Tax=Hemicordylus capensis TaxID=884348 RepID=UPI002304277F|nr:ras-related protein Rab-4B isoform X2 [Hemicordylus capensis]
MGALEGAPRERGRGRRRRRRRLWGGGPPGQAGITQRRGRRAPRPQGAPLPCRGGGGGASLPPHQEGAERRAQGPAGRPCRRSPWPVPSRASKAAGRLLLLLLLLSISPAAPQPRIRATSRAGKPRGAGRGGLRVGDLRSPHQFPLQIPGDRERWNWEVVPPPSVHREQIALLWAGGGRQRPPFPSCVATSCRADPQEACFPSTCWGCST